jgi:hypothetical protein
MPFQFPQDTEVVLISQTVQRYGEIDIDRKCIIVPSGDCKECGELRPMVVRESNLGDGGE